MNRRKARENAFITMFAVSFGQDMEEVVSIAKNEHDEHEVDAFGEELLLSYKQHAEEIDVLITENLKDWKLERLQKVNLAILRLSVAEMLYGPSGLDSVIINEAVELAKQFGGEDDYQFVNGVLGSVSRGKSVKMSENTETEDDCGPEILDEV